GRDVGPGAEDRDREHLVDEERVEHRGRDGCEREQPLAVPVRQPQDGEDDREQDRERPWPDRGEHDHENGLEGELPGKARELTEPEERLDDERRVAERAVEEPEPQRERQLQCDGRAPPLLDRQRTPAGAQLVPEADLLRDLAARADVSLELAHLTAFWRAFTEESFGPEDEDQDQDREDDRLGPVGAWRVPAEPLVEGLDAADHERAENRTGQVADPAEHGGRERDQSELEPLEV